MNQVSEPSGLLDIIALLSTQSQSTLCAMSHDSHFDEGLQYVEPAQDGLVNARDEAKTTFADTQTAEHQRSLREKCPISKRPWRQRPMLVWLVLVIVFLLIAVIAIGSGIGGAMASRKTTALGASTLEPPAISSASSTASSTPSSTTSASSAVTATPNSDVSNPASSCQPDCRQGL